MKVLRNYLEKIKPTFSEGGKFSWLHSVFDGIETLLFVSNRTSKCGVHIHDAIDSKRTMTMVLTALFPVILFGMYNVGYQHFLAIGEHANTGFFHTFLFGLLVVLPKIVVSYLVALTIEFTVAQYKKEEIQEGILVTGMLIPLILPPGTPLWMIAVATAIGVIFGKEVFGGTGYNPLNVALVVRAILFFSYPTEMSGTKPFVYTNSIFGFGGGQTVDAFSGATPLGQIATAGHQMPVLHNIVGQTSSSLDAIIGLIPGSIGETSVICILLGAIFLIWTGVGSWKIMLSGVLGCVVMALIFNIFGTTASMQMTPLQHLIYGGFAFGIVFMATDPVTSARTETGKWIYGFLIGVMAVFIRVLNPGYSEGMMLAIILMNVFAPLIDYFVVEANIKKRLGRVKALN